MQNNVVDLIIFLVRRLRIGDELNDVKLDGFEGYDKSEISAAWSWVLQKYQSGDLNKEKTAHGKPRPHRVLHFAERMMITKEAYGYLLELYDMGLISAVIMEKIIEQAMLHSAEQITLEKAREMVVKAIFSGEENPQGNAMYLKGNESIH